MDVDDFFEEQERRMNLPDEDIDEYIRTRLAATRATQSWSNPIQDNAMPMLNCVTYDGHCITCVSNSPEQHTSFGMTSTYSSSPLDNLPTRSKRKISENPVDGPSKRTKTGQPHSVHPVVPDIRASPTHNETSSKLTKDYILVDSAAKQASNSDPSTGTAASRHHSGGGFAQNGSALDDNTPRTTCSRRSTESKSLLPEDSAVDVIVITRSRQHPVCSGQNNSEPHSLELPGIQEISGAVSGAEVVIRSSNHASSHGEPSRVMNNARSVESEGLSTTVSDHSPAADVFSCSSVTSHRGGAFHKPTLIVHVQDSYPTNGSPQCPDAHPLPCISPVRIPPSIPPTPPENVATSASRPARDSRGDDTAQVSTPRPFSEADVSNITSPGLTPLFRGGSKRESAEPKLRETVHRNRKMKATMSTTKGRKKAQLMTPLEYAQRLQSNLVVSVTRKTNYLQGKQIFYVGGDMQFASAKTRGRMEYIVKHGGTLVPKYDPAFVTHIVTDVNARSTLRALSLKSLLEIPRHIPTVTWSWVISGYERASRDKDTARGNGKGKGKTKAVDAQDNVLDLEFLHAAFPERIDAGSGWLDSFRQEKSGATSGAQSSKAKIFNDGSGDVSGIFDFTQENPTKKDTTSWRDARLTVLPPPPLDLKSSEGPDRTRSEAPEPPDVTRSRRPSADTENGAEDPLSEYYAHAKAERDAAWKCNESESDDGDDDEDDGLEVLNGPAPKRGFTCDHKQPQQAVCANQDVVDKLEELMELHKAKPSDHDRWRVFSYAKCIRALRNYPKPIRSFSEARFIRGVGEKTALKIMEIIETGRLRRIAYERTEDVEATKLFQGIYGVGRKTAFAWFASGMSTLDDIKARKGGLKLSPVQEIGLRFYDDINSRIPRAEVERIFDMIKPKALAIDSNIFIEIMGSFRRGKADCGDIDILITRPTTDGKTHQGVLPLLLERLHAANILTEDLALPEDFSMLELTYRGLCKLPEAGAKRRRIDILCVPWESRGAALLYYTGDDIFNRAMRMKANVLGYSLNQRGLYSGVVRDPRNRTVKVCNGSIIASETEEEIFKILGVPWQEPHERVRG